MITSSKLFYQKGKRKKTPDILKLYPQTVKTHLLKRCKSLFVHQLVNLSNFSVLFCELNNNQGFSSPCSLETYSGTVWMVCAPKKLSCSPLPLAPSFSPLSIRALNDAFTKSVAQRKAQPFGTHKTWKENAWPYEWNVDFHTICFPKCGTIGKFFPLYLLGTVLFFPLKTPLCCFFNAELVTDGDCRLQSCQSKGI